MGSVATTGFSVANLLQTLTSAGSPQLSAALSSPTVQTALQNAPTSDLVDLSDQAMQLQEVSDLFGNSSTADTATLPAALDPASSLLSSTSSTGSSGSSTASLANQLSGYQSDLQSEELQTLFGMNSTSPPPSSLFDALG
jgi:hypothetical protein